MDHIWFSSWVKGHQRQILRDVLDQVAKQDGEILKPNFMNDSKGIKFGKTDEYVFMSDLFKSSSVSHWKAILCLLDIEDKQ